MNTIIVKTRNIIIIFSILMSTFAFAQNYMPLPDSGAIWIVWSGNSEWQLCQHIFIPESNRDTLINGHTYVKLFAQFAIFYPPFTPWPDPSNLGGPGYYGAYRSDDSGRSYFKFSNGGGNLGDAEILLMDLTVELGDTIKQLPTYSSYDYEYIYSDLIVDSIDYVENGLYTRKRIMLRNLNPPWGMECDFHWVEGLGNVSSGFFNAVGCGFENVGLSCMSINDTIFVGATATLEDPVPGNCYFPYTNSVSLDVIKTPLLVYPSPATDYVIFETVLNIQGAVITITDITGRPVAAFPITGEKTVWQTENLSPGIYLYTIQLSGNHYSGKILLQKKY